MELKTCYLIDKDGYYAGESIAQLDPIASEPTYLLPLSSTFVRPMLLAEYFYRFTGGAWVEEKKPTTAEECVAIGAVRHIGQTARDIELVRLFQVLCEGSTTHRIERSNDAQMTWSVVEIPQPTAEEKERATARSRYDELQAYLRDTDYVAIKIDEGAATRDEYADVLTKREKTREEIRVLEAKYGF